MDAEEPDLAVLDPGVGVGQGHPPGPEGLHLAALQRDAALEGLEDVVVVAGPTVAGDLDPVGPVVGCRACRRSWRCLATTARCPSCGHRSETVPPVLDGRRPPVPSCDARLPASVHAEIVGHCLGGLPDEALWAARRRHRTGDVARCYPTRNSAASAKLYAVDPGDHLRADRDAESAGIEIIGVFHSHTHTDAYPSPTDVAQAPDPGWHYVLVRCATPTRRPLLPHREGRRSTRSRSSSRRGDRLAR